MPHCGMCKGLFFFFGYEIYTDCHKDVPFHDALEPRFHIAGLPFTGGKRQTRNVGRKESEHIYDMGYKDSLKTLAGN